MIAGIEALFLCSIRQLLATRKALVERLAVTGGYRRVAKSGSALDI